MLKLRIATVTFEIPLGVELNKFMALMALVGACKTNSSRDVVVALSYDAASAQVQSLARDIALKFTNKLFKCLKHFQKVKLKMKLPWSRCNAGHQSLQAQHWHLARGPLPPAERQPSSAHHRIYLLLRRTWQI